MKERVRYIFSAIKDFLKNICTMFRNSEKKQSFETNTANSTSWDLSLEEKKEKAMSYWYSKECAKKHHVKKDVLGNVIIYP